MLVVCIIWLAKFAGETRERPPVKWTDMSYSKRTALGLIFAGMCLNLYLIIGNGLALTNITVLPLSDTFSIYGSALSWAVTLTIIGLVVIYSLRFPRHC